MSCRMHTNWLEFMCVNPMSHTQILRDSTMVDLNELSPQACGEGMGVTTVATKNGDFR